MVCLLGRGSRSKSSSVSTTYCPLAYSYPRAVSFQGTSTSSVGHQRRCWSRVPQVACSRLNEMSLLSVAPNSLTGMLTIPKLIDPLQIALAMLVPPSANGARVRYPTQERRIPSFGTPPAVFSTPIRRYPQDYQHHLLINKDLRRWIILPWGRRLLWDESHAYDGFSAPGASCPPSQSPALPSRIWALGRMTDRCRLVPAQQRLPPRSQLRMCPRSSVRLPVRGGRAR